MYDPVAFREQRGRWPIPTRDAIFHIFQECEKLESQVLDVAQWDALVMALCHTPSLRDDPSKSDEKRAEIAMLR